MHLYAGPPLHSISIGPASAANAGGFLQVVESKARKHATLCARLASSRFRFNTKTYRELGCHCVKILGPDRRWADRSNERVRVASLFRAYLYRLGFRAP